MQDLDSNSSIPTVAEVLLLCRDDLFPFVKTIIIPVREIEDFFIRMEIAEYHADFVCAECVSMSQGDSGEWDIPGFSIDPENLADSTSDPLQALAFCSGNIKSSGCINIEFYYQRVAPLHFCGRQNAARIGKLFDQLYDLAREIPRWYGD